MAKLIYKSEWCEIKPVIYSQEEDPDAQFAAKLMISRRGAKKIRKIYQEGFKEKVEDVNNIE
jgi:hypothetical protein